MKRSDSTSFLPSRPPLTFSAPEGLVEDFVSKGFAVLARLEAHPSVYILHVAAGTLGCLGRRAIATEVGVSLVPACLEALVHSFSHSPYGVSGTAITLLPQRAILATPENSHDEIRCLLREIPVFPI